MATDPKARLEELRARIDAEDISYGELAELQGMTDHIDPGDVQLLEWAGVPEFIDDEAPEGDPDFVASYERRQLR